MRNAFNLGRALGLLLAAALLVGVLSCSSKDAPKPNEPTSLAEDGAGAPKTPASAPKAPDPPVSKDIIELKPKDVSGPASLKAQPVSGQSPVGQRVKTVSGSTCIDAGKYPNMSLQELQKILHDQIVAQLAGKLLSDASGAQAGNVQSQLSRQVEIEEERYYNGEPFAQLCVSATGRMASSKFTALGKQHVSHERYCLSDPRLSPGDLRASALQAILIDILRQYDPKLAVLSLEQITKSNTLTDITIADVSLDTAKNEYCLRVEAELDPVAAMDAVANIPAAPTPKPETPAPQPAKLVMTLDLSTLQPGQTIASFGAYAAVVNTAKGKTLALNGQTQAEVFIDSLVPAPPKNPIPPAQTAVPEQTPQPAAPEQPKGQTAEKPADKPEAAKSPTPEPPASPFVAFVSKNIQEFTAVLTLNYDLQPKQDDAPLLIPLLDVVYANKTKDQLVMRLDLDDLKKWTVQYLFGTIQTSPVPAPQRFGATTIELAKQNNTLKIWLNKNFLGAVSSPNRQLRAFNAHLFNNSALTGLRLETSALMADTPPPVEKKGRSAVQGTMP
jgi:hypothetical protein